MEINPQHILPMSRYLAYENMFDFTSCFLSADTYIYCCLLILYLYANGSAIVVTYTYMLKSCISIVDIRVICEASWVLFVAYYAIPVYYFLVFRAQNSMSLSHKGGGFVLCTQTLYAENLDFNNR